MNDIYELIQFGEGYRENLSKGLQVAGEFCKVNTSSQKSNPENCKHTQENFIKEKVYNDLKEEIEKSTRKLKEFIIEDLKPAIKSEIEGKLITDVNHAVSDVVKVTDLAELLKCKSEIYELKESQLRLDQQSFNSSKSTGNLSETGRNSAVHGNITNSVDSTSSSTEPQYCQKVTLEANKDADKEKVDEKSLCVNEVFIKNDKTVKLVKSGDTAAGVIERTCDYVRNAQATKFTGIVLMAGRNELGGRKKSNGNDKRPE